MAHQTIRPSLIRERLSGNLCVIMRRASLALQGVENGDASQLGRVPGAWMGLDCGTLDVETVKRVRDDADTWVLAASFGTLLTVIDLALQSAADCCNLGVIGARGPMTQGDADQIPAHQRRFEKLNYPDKVKYLRETYGAAVTPPRTSDIDGYRDVRNCLEHRHGVVGEMDLRGRAHLEVHWVSIEPIVVRHSGEVVPVELEAGGRPVGGGMFVEAGEKIGTRSVNRTRQFTLGERIHFSRQEFAEICINVHFWGVELSKAVEAFVRQTLRHGDPPQTPTPPGEPPR